MWDAQGMLCGVLGRMLCGLLCGMSSPGAEQVHKQQHGLPPTRFLGAWAPSDTAAPAWGMHPALVSLRDPRAPGEHSTLD